MILTPSITRETVPGVAVENLGRTHMNRKTVDTINRPLGTPMRQVETAPLPLQPLKCHVPSDRLWTGCNRLCGHSLLPRYFRFFRAGQESDPNDLASLRTQDPLSSPTPPIVPIRLAPRRHEFTRERTALTIFDARSCVRSFEITRWAGHR